MNMTITMPQDEVADACIEWLESNKSITVVEGDERQFRTKDGRSPVGEKVQQIEFVVEVKV